MARMPATVCVLALVCATSARGTDIKAEEAKLAAAGQQIQEQFAKWRAQGASGAVAFRTLDGEAEYHYSADAPFPAGGTIKLPTLIAVFRQLDEGRLHLAEPLFVHNQFSSVFDGSPFQVYREDDSETGLYKAEGKTRTIGELCELMITAESKFATNLLIQKVELDNIRATVLSLNAENMRVLRSFGDEKATTQGRLLNTTTVRTLQTLMTAMLEGKAASREGSAMMIGMLERRHVSDGISAGLPAETRVAQQTGTMPGIQLKVDSAIVYAPRPFVLVIRTVRIPESDSAALMANITRLLYQAVE